MREVTLNAFELADDRTLFAACLATILEVRLEDVPTPDRGDHPGWRITRWLGGQELGLVRVADAGSFSWAGPWIALVGVPGRNLRRAVVMFGIPSGVVWDPAGVTSGGDWAVEDGFVVAALDVAVGPTPRSTASPSVGIVDAIWIAGSAGSPAVVLNSVRAIAGQGLEGDRHVAGTGTFPSGLPGSALTLIEAEVCDSFTPPLHADEHRRNIVTRGIDLNSLVGHQFDVGSVRCVGARLCEPCIVIERYAARSVLRKLVHRGGLRADIISDGVIRVGDPVRAAR